MFVQRCIYALVALVVGVGWVRAGACYPVAAAVYPPAVVAVAPVVYVPVYSIQYLPPAAVTAEAEKIVEERDATEIEELSQKLADLTKELSTLRGELARARGGNRESGTALGSGAGLLAARCSKCHGATAAEEKGGGFVLIEANGKPSVLSLEQRKRTIRKIANGTMPPPPAKLDDGERKAIAEFLNQSE